jgi:hypothetical protein
MLFVGALHPVGVAADTGARVAQSTIRHSANPADAGDPIIAKPICGGRIASPLAASGRMSENEMIRLVRLQKTPEGGNCHGR